MKSVAFLLVVAMIVLSACTKKHDPHDLKYSADEFQQLSHAAKFNKPIGEFIINFSDYSLGVIKEESFSMEYERIKFNAIKFETEKMARDEAFRLNQYYARNILFDQVEGEPILEDYVIATFGAKNPKKSIQRNSKKVEPAHHH